MSSKKRKKASLKKRKTGKADESVRIMVRNRAASRRWETEESVEAGLVLSGTEVKAIREGKAQISDAYGVYREQGFFLVNLHIGQYGAAGPYSGHDPLRPRKLLLKKEEIRRLKSKLERKGYSLIPLDIHFNGAWAKVKMGLCRGKTVSDRRDDIRKQEADREMERAIRIK